MKKFPTLALKLKVAKVAGRLPLGLSVNHRPSSISLPSSHSIAPQAQSRKVSKP